MKQITGEVGMTALVWLSAWTGLALMCAVIEPVDHGSAASHSVLRGS